jgi:hypothetical protein
MIGIIPSSTKTFEVMGTFNSDQLVEGKLYVDTNGRVFMYSTIEKRSNPDTGYFPIWDGKNKYISKFSNEKYMDKDVTLIDIKTLASSINKDVADNVLYQQRRSDNSEVLEPTLSDGDNMFTQCIKGVINAKQVTLIDLMDMSCPHLDEKTISNYYSALIKITFMRLDKWNIWIDVILHVKYTVNVYKEDKKLLSYDYPNDKFETGVVNYSSIIATNDDPFKKIIKILMIMENINKNSLRSKEVDDYTINNMLTTLNGRKSLSAQLFSRFIRMAGLSYEVILYDNSRVLFEYKES